MALRTLALEVAERVAEVEVNRWRDLFGSNCDGDGTKGS
jgi:hypothetical protein